MTCWRCGRLGRHAAWCSMPGGCDHCGGNPCRWWCIGDLDVSGAANPNSHESGLQDARSTARGTSPDVRGMSYEDAITGRNRHARDRLIRGLRRDEREPLAGVRLRSDLNDEILHETLAIAGIEKRIDEYVPPTCEFCTAPAMDVCSLCDRFACEDDFVAEGLCVECDAELLS